MFFFRLLPSRVATTDFTSPCVPFFCTLLRDFLHSHSLSDRIHKPPSRPSPFPLSWQFHPQHPSLNMYTSSFLHTRTNHLSLASRVVSKPSHQCAVPLMYSFLILSILVTPNENLQRCHLRLCLPFFVSATVSNPLHCWSQSHFHMTFFSDHSILPVLSSSLLFHTLHYCVQLRPDI